MNELPELDSAALKARSKLLWVFAGLLSLDLLMTLIDQDYRGLIRLVLTILLMYLVLQGQKWAKWWVVISSTLAIPIGLLVTIGSEKMIEILFSLTYSLLSITLVLHLTRSKPLARYFDYKRRLSSLKF